MKDLNGLHPSHPLFPVFDRKVDALPNDNCAIEIFNDGEWLACEWNPKTTDSQADVGYIGTARTTDSPIQIGLHAWEQNNSEFQYFCLPMRSDNPKNNKNVMESLKNNKNVATNRVLIASRTTN